MKKGILCILLSLLLVTPLFVGCNSNTGNVGTEAIIYTLYTICEEGTTEESIREVELALNRLLFYRLNGIMVKLEMVTEDEYDELIAEKFEETQEYQDKITNGEIDPEANKEFITGDDVLKMLENDEEIPLSEPRLDIFLVRGYDQYLKYVEDASVQELDSVLDNYGKALKANIHGTLFEAAKINNKTYGVPVNHAVDQYTYLVFDNDYKSEDVNPYTITSIKDLEDSLAFIKETAPDVVPLKNIVPSSDIHHLLYEGSPFLATKNSSTVSEAYTSGSFKNYFAMIARYNKLGYLGSEDDPEGTEYAIRFEKGNLNELKELYPSEEYTIVEYSAPIATSNSVFSTNPATVGNLFCVSKFVASNDIANVMSLLNALNTDATLMNILLYGVEGEHYVLTEEGQVKRERFDYLVDSSNIGNAFVAKTPYVEGKDAEETKNVWLEATKHNQETIASPALGFAPEKLKFSYMDGSETIEFAEPDYFAAIKSVTDKYYQMLLSGEIDFDYDAIYDEVSKAEFERIEKELKDHYESDVIRPVFEAEVRESAEIKALEPQLQIEAKEEYMQELFTQTKTTWETTIATEYSTENPDASSDQVQQYVAATVTDEFVNERIKIENPQKVLDAGIKGTFDAKVREKVKAIVDEIAKTPRYLNQRAAVLSSQRYADDLKAKRIIAEQQTIPTKIDEKIVLAMQEQIITPMMKEIDVAIKASIDEFYEEYKEVLGYEEIKTLYIEIGYYTEQTVPETNTDTDEPAEPIFAPGFTSWYEFVYKTKVADPYKAVREQTA